MSKSIAKGSTRRKRRASKGAGTLYKRDATGKQHPPDWPGRGAFWLAYSIPNPDGGTGKRIRQALRDSNGNAITDREQAEAERKRILAPYAAGDKLYALRSIRAALADAETEQTAAVEDASPPLKIKNAWTAYHQSTKRPKSGPRTLADYESHWNRFEQWINATHPEAVYLRDVSPDMADAYATDLHGAGLSPNRINKHINYLKLLFRILKKPARITEQPFEEIQRETLFTHSRRELTVAELTLILDRAAGDLGPLLLIGAATGLRLGDCATLQWGEVDLARRLIIRIPNKTKRKQQTVKIGIPPRLHETLSVTPERERTGYVLPRIAEAYRRDSSIITKAVRAHFVECGIDVHAPGTGHRIKRQADGTPERDKTGQVITEATGKPAIVECGFHSLRHTWVSMHSTAGTPGAVVQATVGHASPAMTAHYAHVDDDTARRVALTLPTFSSGTAATLPAREPLPPWARELIESLTTRNIKAVKAALLEGGAK